MLPPLSYRWFAFLFTGVLLGLLPRVSETRAQQISFNRDVRPILAAKCLACHGPDESHREAGLRLDRRQDAVDYGAIVAGDVDNSLLMERIHSTDPEVVMPPPKTDAALTAEERTTFRRWIEQGATYERHWAFVPPQRPPLPQPPASSDTAIAPNWPRNEIDNFTIHQMREHDLVPAEEADRAALVRRVYLDLIGLPPTPQQADAFIASEDPRAYEHLVDSLLDSPGYGEHWARAWLDLARYSDTNGYEKDRPRSIWPYRDWVIRSLNADLPYDEFTIQQIAGDMLPNATLDQQIATGFHRNTMLNEEGGIDPLEYRFLAMVDRVATTGTVWMGMTTGCAQCHTHKYDPITHTDYYQLMALLNNADEPDLKLPDPERQQQRQRIQQQIDDAIEQLPSQFPVSGEVPPDQQESARQTQLQTALTEWIEQVQPQAANWRVLPLVEWTTNLPKLVPQPDGSVFSIGDVTKRDRFELKFQVHENQLPVTALRIEALPDDRLPGGGPGRTYYEGRKGDFYLSEVSAQWDGQPLEFGKPTFTGEVSGGDQFAVDGDGSTGWKPGSRKGERLQLVLPLRQPITEAGPLSLDLLFERHYVVSLGRFRISVADNPRAAALEISPAVETILASGAPDTWSAADRHTVETGFLLNTDQLQSAQQEIAKLRSRLPEDPHTLVMRERPEGHARPTHRHHRGEYISPRELVTPGIPALFHELTPAEQRPGNRLEFARWLVSPGNPLAARVAVNRAWRSFFGSGLVATSGDFGVQSTPPSHPQLLDWLAVDFMEHGWSTKRLHRQIVTSATYRQSAIARDGQRDRDPENRWLARGPRFRLTGEVIRDSALQAAGKLSDKMYGPGVRPPQPNSVTALAYGGGGWNPSTGEDRYRRSIYTFSKRTAPFAAYALFDAPSGEVCLARRNRSNTPTQALAMLNDPMFVELAQALAKRVDPGNDSPAAIDAALVQLFRHCLTRSPSPDERGRLVEFYEQQHQRMNPAAETALDPWQIAGRQREPVDEGAAGSPATEDIEREAALTMVARAVMNLDEFLNKP